MKRLLCLGFLAMTPGLAACVDDEPPVTSASNSNSDPSSSTDDTLTSGASIETSGGSESSTASVGSSEGSSGGSSSESGTGSESSSGGSAPESSSEGGSESGACEPITEDPSGLGQSCKGAGQGSCADGYTCFDGGGLVSNPLCQILCTQDCACPDGFSCEHMNIKGNEWDQCNAG